MVLCVSFAGRCSSSFRAASRSPPTFSPTAQSCSSTQAHALLYVISWTCLKTRIPSRRKALADMSPSRRPRGRTIPPPHPRRRTPQRQQWRSRRPCLTWKAGPRSLQRAFESGGRRSAATVINGCILGRTLRSRYARRIGLACLA